MRFPLLTFLAGLAVATLLVAPPRLAAWAAPLADAADVLPSEAEITSLLSSLTVSSFEVQPPQGGWDAIERFQITAVPGNPGPEVPVEAWIFAAEHSTDTDAAAFLQTKLVEYRQAAAALGLVGELGPAAPELAMNADEAYFAAFATPDGAPSRMLATALLARYGETVTAVDLSMVWDGPGPIAEDQQRGIGGVLAGLHMLVNEFASE